MLQLAQGLIVGGILAVEQMGIMMRMLVSAGVLANAQQHCDFAVLDRVKVFRALTLFATSVACGPADEMLASTHLSSAEDSTRLLMITRLQHQSD